MCLIVVGWRAHPVYQLIVAANRDEFHSRSAAPAAFWADRPNILAGRDLQAMGTWMGVSRRGKFAAVTNYRGAREPSAAESRGALVTKYLADGALPGAYAAEVAGRGALYSGFNLLVADREELWWMSNRDGAPRRLEPGYYALGNLLLDSPDVQPVKARVADLPPAVEALFSAVGAAKILNPEYGTRCSTVLLDSGNDMRYAERSYEPDGSEGATLHFHFST
ncbi:MAG TPA: NRDE family protein [Burkholderiales bacterium]|nr:NRDE family protein [Burkholderiales bacterium]